MLRSRYNFSFQLKPEYSLPGMFQIQESIIRYGNVDGSV